MRISQTDSLMDPRATCFINPLPHPTVEDRRMRRMTGMWGHGCSRAGLRSKAAEQGSARRMLAEPKVKWSWLEFLTRFAVSLCLGEVSFSIAIARTYRDAVRVDCDLIWPQRWNKLCPVRFWITRVSNTNTSSQPSAPDADAEGISVRHTWLFQAPPRSVAGLSIRRPEFVLQSIVELLFIGDVCELFSILPLCTYLKLSHDVFHNLHREKWRCHLETENGASE